MFTLIVEPLNWPKAQHEHKGHNRAEVAVGRLVFGIYCPEANGWYHWAYLRADTTQNVINTLADRGLTAVMIDANFRNKGPVVVTKFGGE